MKLLQQHHPGHFVGARTLHAAPRIPQAHAAGDDPMSGIPATASNDRSMLRAVSIITERHRRRAHHTGAVASTTRSYGRRSRPSSALTTGVELVTSRVASSS